MQGAQGKNKEDGGKCDWFNDTKPMVMDAIGKIKRDLDRYTTPPASQPGAAMSASAQMQFLGEDDGVRWYWAEPGLFQKPGVYYWNGSENVHVGKEANHSQAQQPSVTVRYDLSPAMVEGAIRDRLIAMGWTPPLQQPKPQPMTDWISVDDRLPEVGQEVLVYRPLAHETNDPHIALRQYIGGSHKSPQGVEHGFDCWCHPSHWMQRPPSPHDDAHHGITSDKEA